MKRLIRKEKRSREPLPVKLVVVGDGAVGKTSLLLAYMRDQFYETHEPTIYETTTKDVTIRAFPKLVIQLTAEDTAGQESYEHFRYIQYTSSNIDVILLCFSVDNKDSLANVGEKWNNELRHYCPGVPIILVGTKIDRRLEQAPPSPVVGDCEFPQTSGEMLDTTAGIIVAQQIGAPYYVECSAKTRQNIEQVFQAAIAVVVKRKQRASQKLCTIL